MPAEFELDPAKRLVRTRAWDLVTAGDLHAVTESLRRLFAEGTIDADWREFVDFRAVTRTDLVPAESVRALAQENPWPTTSRRAIVAPEAAVFGLSRMYELLNPAAQLSLAVVRTEAEALEFLETGIEPRSIPARDRSK